MERNTEISNMAAAIMEGLNEYSDLATDALKLGITEASKVVKKEIQSSAPVRTGAYKKSWTAKRIAETSNSLTMVVHSKNRYQVAHLLEHGHAKRGGGRVAAIPHIAPAEQAGEQTLLQEIERGLR